MNRLRHFRYFVLPLSSVRLICAFFSFSFLRYIWYSMTQQRYIWCSMRLLYDTTALMQARTIKIRGAASSTSLYLSLQHAHPKHDEEIQRTIDQHSGQSQLLKRGIPYCVVLILISSHSRFGLLCAFPSYETIMTSIAWQ